LSADYIFFGSSALEKTISESVLRGRPFGGTGIFLRKDLCSNIIQEFYYERMTVIVVGSLILISMYLPSSKCDRSVNEILIMLSEIESIASSFPNNKLIMGFDANVDLNTSSEVSKILKDFMGNYKLSRCDAGHLDMNDDGLTYTYSHESLKHFSWIDYLLVSDSLSIKAMEFNVIDSAVNMSDHCPIEVSLLLSINEWVIPSMIDELKLLKCAESSFVQVTLGSLGLQCLLLLHL
jgi:exonuclease III